MLTTKLTLRKGPSMQLDKRNAIVYGAAGQTGVSSGGFFPNGLNGNIKTS